MRNLFALVGFVVVVFLGLGWYLNWYRLDWSTGSDGRAKIGLDVDTNKVAGDLKTGANRAGQLIDTLKTKTPAEKAKHQAEDPQFVGPPIPTDWPGIRQMPTVGVPAPEGYGSRR